MFLFLDALALTFSPEARQDSWSAALRTSQWIGLAIWSPTFLLAHRLLTRRLPNRDPYLLPIAALLSGWGLMTLFRLDPGLGFRQSAWLLVGVSALILIIQERRSLHVLRQYKYLMLAAGLTLMALTLILGTNPAGAGPRLWLGCCGVYLQPSEPLKLLLVAYLAAYLADQVSRRAGLIPVALPAILVTGLSLTLLLVQRDLGTASIFILLPAAMLYMATSRGRIPVVTVAIMFAAAYIGYLSIDVVHARLESWLNPWSDPTGRSYQIVQSLMSIANGGVFGRGPGMGSPTLVPVAQSDFIFAAISEETGLLGALGLVAALVIWIMRGMTIAIRTSNSYERLLAAGLTTYMGLQAVLIIGGDLRLLPLTGVTLPFVAYGGSSLLTAFVATALLISISSRLQQSPSGRNNPKPLQVTAAVLCLGLVGASISQAWWAVIRSPDLLSRTDNPRRAIADRYVKRGALLDRNSLPIDVTIGTSGNLERRYWYPPLAPVSGYTHPVYGQAGLEATLDNYLRGLQGNPASLVAWDQLIYGTPPPGLDVRLTIDLGLQEQADNAIGGFKGALVLINARSGEILAMASHPGFDPNALDETGGQLAHDQGSPLINRATQGAYALGKASDPFLSASGLGSATAADLAALYQTLGFFTPPQLRIPVGSATLPRDPSDVRVSPLQVAIASAALSNGGILPAPRIALAVDTPQQGWVVLPALEASKVGFDAVNAEAAAQKLAVAQEVYWEYLRIVEQSPGQYVTWYLAGSVPQWTGTPIAIAVLLEANDPRAAAIGQHVLLAALNR